MEDLMKEETSARIKSRTDEVMKRLRNMADPKSIDDIETIALDIREELGRIVAEELAREAATVPQTGSCAPAQRIAEEAGMDW
jgi:archaellum component FlaC